jgi:hypothetical protein
MGIRTKYFIELRDISGFRLTCQNCKSSVSLPMKDQVTSNLLRACPQCQHVWTFDKQTGSPVGEQQIIAYVKATMELAAVIGDTGGSFMLELETDGTPELGQSTKRWL